MTFGCTISLYACSGDSPARTCTHAVVTHPPELERDRINDGRLLDLLARKHAPRDRDRLQLVAIREINLVLHDVIDTSIKMITFTAQYEYFMFSAR